MEVYLMRHWTHHEPKRPKGSPGLLSSGHKPPKGMAAVMLHVGNIPIEDDVRIDWIRRQIESLGFVHHSDAGGKRADDWRLNPDELRTCPCGWSGTYRQASYDFAEPDTWLDACPKCGAVLSGEVAEEARRHAGQEELF